VASTIGVDQSCETTSDENICELAHHYGLAAEHLAFANNVPADEYLYPHKALRVPLRRILPLDAPAHGAVLNIPERALYFFEKGHATFYPVACGRSGFLTPRGNWSVICKVKNPTWVPPGWSEVKHVFPPGPDNPLGNRWIGLSCHGVGIHGTNSPLAIGMSVSHGCVRMYPDQLLGFYEHAYVGMPVRIEYETAKLGRAPNGDYLLATFPDVYHLQDPVARAWHLVCDAGLGKRVSKAEVEAIATRQSGVAEVLPLHSVGPAPSK
jgi:L,D-transpeptidase ErfK/SrfK